MEALIRQGKSPRVGRLKTWKIDAIRSTADTGRRGCSVNQVLYIWARAAWKVACCWLRAHNFP
jgi:hypothetical protein